MNPDPTKVGAASSDQSADDDAWASDTDLWQLDTWSARHTPRSDHAAVTWSDPPDTAVRDSPHLALLVQALGEGAAATARLVSGDRWGRVAEVAVPAGASSYIVDVHEVAGDDGARVFRGTRSSEHRVTPGGSRRVDEAEAFDPVVAANVLWSFLHGGLPVGFLSISHRASARGRAACAEPASPPESISDPPA